MRKRINICIIIIIVGIIGCNYIKKIQGSQYESLPNWVNHVVSLKLSKMNELQRKLYFSEFSKYMIGYNLNFIGNVDKIIGGFVSVRQLSSNKIAHEENKELYFILEGNFDLDKISVYFEQNDAFSFDKKIINNTPCFFQNSGNIVISLISSDRILITNKINIKASLKWYYKNEPSSSFMNLQDIKYLDDKIYEDSDFSFIFQKDELLNQIFSSIIGKISDNLTNYITSLFNDIKVIYLLVDDLNSDSSKISMYIACKNNQVAENMKKMIETYLLLIKSNVIKNFNFFNLGKESDFSYKFEVDDNVLKLYSMINLEVFNKMRSLYEQRNENNQNQKNNTK